MSDSTERIKKFLENETNFIRYQITGFEYDRGKRILSEVTQAKPNDLTVFLPIHERWVPEKYTANARRPFHQLHYVVKGIGIRNAVGTDKIIENKSLKPARQK